MDKSFFYKLIRKENTELLTQMIVTNYPGKEVLEDLAWTSYRNNKINSLVTLIKTGELSNECVCRMLKNAVKNGKKEVIMAIVISSSNPIKMASKAVRYCQKMNMEPNFLVPLFEMLIK